MVSITCLDSKLLNHQNWYSRFQLAPFRRGEALTVANALRRSLLSEKSSFFISWVDFYNAEMPYSVLTGMRESIFDILINLKQIIFTIEKKIPLPSQAYEPRFSDSASWLPSPFPETNSPVNLAYLNVKGPAKIYAKHIKLPKGIKCLTPNKYLVTLTDDGILSLRFLISRELFSNEKNFSSDHSPNVFFSPRDSFSVALLKKKKTPMIPKKNLPKLNSLFIHKKKKKLLQVDAVSPFVMANTTHYSLRRTLQGKDQEKAVSLKPKAARSHHQAVQPPTTKKNRGQFSFHLVANDLKLKTSQAEKKNGSKKLPSISKNPRKLKEDTYFWPWQSHSTSASPTKHEHLAKLQNHSTVFLSGIPRHSRNDQLPIRSWLRPYGTDTQYQKKACLLNYDPLVFPGETLFTETMAFHSKMETKDKNRHFKKTFSWAEKPATSLDSNTLNDTAHDFFLCFRKKQRSFEISPWTPEALNQSHPLPIRSWLRKLAKKQTLETSLSSETFDFSFFANLRQWTLQSPTVLGCLKKTCLINVPLKHYYYKNACFDRFLFDLLNGLNPSLIGSRSVHSLANPQHPLVAMKLKRSTFPLNLENAFNKREVVETIRYQENGLQTNHSLFSLEKRLFLLKLMLFSNHEDSSLESFASEKPLAEETSFLANTFRTDQAKNEEKKDILFPFFHTLNFANHYFESFIEKIKLAKIEVNPTTLQQSSLEKPYPPSFSNFKQPSDFLHLRRRLYLPKKKLINRLNQVFALNPLEVQIYLVKPSKKKDSLLTSDTLLRSFKRKWIHSITGFGNDKTLPAKAKPSGSRFSSKALTRYYQNHRLHSSLNARTLPLVFSLNYLFIGFLYLFFSSHLISHLFFFWLARNEYLKNNGPLLTFYKRRTTQEKNKSTVRAPTNKKFIISATSFEATRKEMKPLPMLAYSSQHRFYKKWLGFITRDETSPPTPSLDQKDLLAKDAKLIKGFSHQTIHHLVQLNQLEFKKTMFLFSRFSSFSDFTMPFLPSHSCVFGDTRQRSQPNPSFASPTLPSKPFFLAMNFTNDDFFSFTHTCPLPTLSTTSLAHPLAWKQWAVDQNLKTEQTKSFSIINSLRQKRVTLPFYRKNVKFSLQKTLLANFHENFIFTMTHRLLSKGSLSTTSPPPGFPSGYGLANFSPLSSKERYLKFRLLNSWQKPDHRLTVLLTSSYLRIEPMMAFLKQSIQFKKNQTMVTQPQPVSLTSIPNTFLVGPHFYQVFLGKKKKKRKILQVSSILSSFKAIPLPGQMSPALNKFYKPQKRGLLKIKKPHHEKKHYHSKFFFCFRYTYPLKFTIFQTLLYSGFPSAYFPGVNRTKSLLVTTPRSYFPGVFSSQAASRRLGTSEKTSSSLSLPSKIKLYWKETRVTRMFHDQGWNLPVSKMKSFRLAKFSTSKGVMMVNQSFKIYTDVLVQENLFLLNTFNKNFDIPQNIQRLSYNNYISLLRKKKANQGLVVTSRDNLLYFPYQRDEANLPKSLETLLSLPKQKGSPITLGFDRMNAQWKKHLFNFNLANNQFPKEIAYAKKATFLNSQKILRTMGTKFAKISSDKLNHGTLAISLKKSWLNIINKQLFFGSPSMNGFYTDPAYPVIRWPPTGQEKNALNEAWKEFKKAEFKAFNKTILTKFDIITLKSARKVVNSEFKMSYQRLLKVSEKFPEELQKKQLTFKERLKGLRISKFYQPTKIRVFNHPLWHDAFIFLNGFHSRKSIFSLKSKPLQLRYYFRFTQQKEEIKTNSQFQVNVPYSPSSSLKKFLLHQFSLRSVRQSQVDSTDHSLLTDDEKNATFYSLKKNIHMHTDHFAYTFLSPKKNGFFFPHTSLTYLMDTHPLLPSEKQTRFASSRPDVLKTTYGSQANPLESYLHPHLLEKTIRSMRLRQGLRNHNFYLAYLALHKFIHPPFYQKYEGVFNYLTFAKCFTCLHRSPELDQLNPKTSSLPATAAVSTLDAYSPPNVYLGGKTMTPLDSLLHQFQYIPNMPLEVKQQYSMVNVHNISHHHHSKKKYWEYVKNQFLQEIPLNFAVFFHRRFLWNAKKISLQIFQNFILPLVADRKLRNSSIKPIFKQIKLKKIAGVPTFTHHFFYHEPMVYVPKIQNYGIYGLLALKTYPNLMTPSIFYQPGLAPVSTRMVKNTKSSYVNPLRMTQLASFTTPGIASARASKIRGISSQHQTLMVSLAKKNTRVANLRYLFSSKPLISRFSTKQSFPKSTMVTKLKNTMILMLFLSKSREEKIHFEYFKKTNQAPFQANQPSEAFQEKNDDSSLNQAKTRQIWTKHYQKRLFLSILFTHTIFHDTKVPTLPKQITSNSKKLGILSHQFFHWFLARVFIQVNYLFSSEFLTSSLFITFPFMEARQSLRNPSSLEVGLSSQIKREPTARLNENSLSRTPTSHPHDLPSTPDQEPPRVAFSRPPLPKETQFSLNENFPKYGTLNSIREYAKKTYLIKSRFALDKLWENKWLLSFLTINKNDASSKFCFMEIVSPAKKDTPIRDTPRHGKSFTRGVDLAPWTVRQRPWLDPVLDTVHGLAFTHGFENFFRYQKNKKIPVAGDLQTSKRSYQRRSIGKLSDLLFDALAYSGMKRYDHYFHGITKSRVKRKPNPRPYRLVSHGFFTKLKRQWPLPISHAHDLSLAWDKPATVALRSTPPPNRYDPKSRSYPFSRPRVLKKKNKPWAASLGVRRRSSDFFQMLGSTSWLGEMRRSPLRPPTFFSTETPYKNSFANERLTAKERSVGNPFPGVLVRHLSSRRKTEYVPLGATPPGLTRFRIGTPNFNKRLHRIKNFYSFSLKLKKPSLPVSYKQPSITINEKQKEKSTTYEESFIMNSFSKEINLWSSYFFSSYFLCAISLASDKFFQTLIKDTFFDKWSWQKKLVIIHPFSLEEKMIARQLPEKNEIPEPDPKSLWLANASTDTTHLTPYSEAPSQVGSLDKNARVSSSSRLTTGLSRKKKKRRALSTAVKSSGVTKKNKKISSPKKKTSQVTKKVYTPPVSKNLKPMTFKKNTSLVSSNQAKNVAKKTISKPTNLNQQTPKLPRKVLPSRTKPMKRSTARRHFLPLRPVNKKKKTYPLAVSLKKKRPWSGRFPNFFYGAKRIKTILPFYFYRNYAWPYQKQPSNRVSLIPLNTHHTLMPSFFLPELASSVSSDFFKDSKVRLHSVLKELATERTIPQKTIFSFWTFAQRIIRTDFKNYFYARQVDSVRDSHAQALLSSKPNFLDPTEVMVNPSILKETPSFLHQLANFWTSLVVRTSHQNYIYNYLTSRQMMHEKMSPRWKITLFERIRRDRSLAINYFRMEEQKNAVHKVNYIIEYLDFRSLKKKNHLLSNEHTLPHEFEAFSLRETRQVLKNRTSLEHRFFQKLIRTRRKIASLAGMKKWVQEGQHSLSTRFLTFDLWPPSYQAGAPSRVTRWGTRTYRKDKGNRSHQKVLEKLTQSGRKWSVSTAFPLNKIRFEKQYVRNFFYGLPTFNNSSGYPVLTIGLRKAAQAAYVAQKKEARLASTPRLEDLNSPMINTHASQEEYLQIDIWTNGSISPREALTHAFRKLVELFYQIGKYISIKPGITFPPQAKSSQERDAYYHTLKKQIYELKADYDLHLKEYDEEEFEPINPRTHLPYKKGEITKRKLLLKKKMLEFEAIFSKPINYYDAMDKELDQEKSDFSQIWPNLMADWTVDMDRIKDRKFVYFRTMPKPKEYTYEKKKEPTMIDELLNSLLSSQTTTHQNTNPFEPTFYHERVLFNRNRRNLLNRTRLKRLKRPLPKQNNSPKNQKTDSVKRQKND